LDLVFSTFGLFGFFSNPTRENPLLKETFEKIDDKKVQLESMKESLHNILAGENQ
jgi:hypothetical protein